MRKQSFPLLSHTHTSNQPPLIHSGNHACKHSPPQTLVPWPPTAGWVRPHFGWRPEFLTLGRVIYSVSGAWWEVHGGRSEQHRSLSRSTVLPCKKCPYRYICCLFLICIYRYLVLIHTKMYTLLQGSNLLTFMPFTLSTGMFPLYSGSLSFNAEMFNVRWV